MARTQLDSAAMAEHAAQAAALLKAWPTRPGCACCAAWSKVKRRYRNCRR
jgi:hypothetical protein